MPSVTMDRQILTIQMRKYSPARPVNLRGTMSLAADSTAADGCANSPPGLLSLTGRTETVRSIDVRLCGLKEFGSALYFKKIDVPAAVLRVLNSRESNPISALLRAGERQCLRPRPKKPWAS